MIDLHYQYYGTVIGWKHLMLNNIDIGQHLIILYTLVFSTPELAKAIILSSDPEK